MNLYSDLDDKYLILKALRHGSHSLTCKKTPCLPLAFVRVHQMALPRTVVTTSSCSLLLIYRPRKDERLSRPIWLTYSGRFTGISGYLSAAGGAHNTGKVRRSNASVLRLRHATNQPLADTNAQLLSYAMCYQQNIQKGRHKTNAFLNSA